jgi:hypothetical protein
MNKLTADKGVMENSQAYSQQAADKKVMEVSYWYTEQADSWQGSYGE